MGLCWNDSAVVNALLTHFVITWIRICSGEDVDLSVWIGL